MTHCLNATGKLSKMRTEINTGRGPRKSSEDVETQAKFEWFWNSAEKEKG